MIPYPPFFVHCGGAGGTTNTPSQIVPKRAAFVSTLCSKSLDIYDKQTPPSKVLSHCVGVRVCAHIHPLCGLVPILYTHIVGLCSSSLCFIPVHVCHTSISSAWEISPGNQGMRLPPTICSAQVLRTKFSLQIHVRAIFYTMHKLKISSSCICAHQLCK